MHAEQVPQARSSSPASVSGNYADFYKNNFFPARYSCTSYILKVLCFCYSKGILAGAQLTLPKDCKNNKFCEITKMILGPTFKFYIYGNFEWKKVKVAVGFAHIRLWDGLYFDKLELYVEVSPFWPFFSSMLAARNNSSDFVDYSRQLRKNPSAPLKSNWWPCQ